VILRAKAAAVSVLVTSWSSVNDILDLLLQNLVEKDNYNWDKEKILLTRSTYIPNKETKYLLFAYLGLKYRKIKNIMCSDSNT
jgi:hypothetical protein